MSIISSDKKTVRRITRMAIEACILLSISYLESTLMLNIFLPFPGFKLGLANIVITIVCFSFSFTEAVILSILRLFLNILLFGNLTSVFFSFCGTVLMLFGLIIGKYILKKYLSFLGISVICAAFHNIGQIFGACIMFGMAVLSYLPIMIIAAIIFGSITGLFMNFFYAKIDRICMNERD